METDTSPRTLDFTQASDSVDSFLLDEKPKGKILSDRMLGFYFFMMGGAAGIAWNATTNSYSYYEAKYPSDNVTFVFPLASYVSQFIFILVINKICSLLSYHIRLIGCLIMLACITLFISIEAQLFQGTLFGMCLIMLILFILGFCNGMVYSCATGLAARVEPRYTVYVLMGGSFFGLFASSSKALVLSIFDPSSDGDLISVLVYYILILIVILVGLALHFKFIKSDFYLSKCLDDQEYDDSTRDESLIRRKISDRSLKILKIVAKQIKVYLFLVFILYVQLDLVFPGVMLKKPMPSMAAHTQNWSMMAAFTAFLIAGKKVSQYRRFYGLGAIVGVLLIRFVLMAFFILQAVTLSIAVLNTEWFGYVNVALFGLTTGFCNAGLFILAAEQVCGEKKETAIFLSVFICNMGAIVGGFSALTLENIGPPQ